MPNTNVRTWARLKSTVKLLEEVGDYEHSTPALRSDTIPSSHNCSICKVNLLQGRQLSKSEKGSTLKEKNLLQFFSYIRLLFKRRLCIGKHP